MNHHKKVFNQLNHRPILPIDTFDSILKLQQETDNKLQSLGRRYNNNAQLIINSLFQHPVTNAQKVKEVTQLSMPSVYKMIEEMEKLDIIEEITGGKREKLYSFREYTKLFR